MNGIPKRVMGNGEGWTTLILTDAESRLIRQVLEVVSAPSTRPEAKTLAAYNAGIQRATDRIKAEFEAEQKRRKDAKK
jgi:hypothetical protein